LVPKGQGFYFIMSHFVPILNSVIWVYSST
jgi:hypothetical protein